MAIKNTIWKVIRYLVTNNYLGYRALNMVGYGVNFDVFNGRVYQTVGNRRIYILHPKHGVPNYTERDTVAWLCEDIYYGKYRPSDSDVILDIGTGYGHEIAWLKSKCNAKVICIEPNPEVFVCLQLNLLGLEGVDLYNRFIGSKEYINFPLTTDYAGATSQGEEVGIRVHGTNLDKIVREDEEIALMKLNIEGGEVDLLESSNLTKIRRIIVSCHDFRANRGDGEYFRTYDKVKAILSRKGYILEKVDTDYYPTPDWRDSVKFWIYAHR